MENDQTNTPADALSRHIEVTKNMKQAIPSDFPPGHLQQPGSGGLSDLQKTTVSLMNSQPKGWGFSNSAFHVKRQKIGDDEWRLTVKNPKTREIILEVEGHGDKVFAHEDSLARMAEALSEKDLKITKHK